MAFLLAMTTDSEQLYAIVRGQVQGVNFRYSTQAQARRLGLSGWVRNRADGAVEVLAEGPRSQLDQLLEFLHHGPRAASVAEVQPAWRAATNSFREFEVRW
jgi:acylphosphatase